ncbi:hypothetical protein [Amycolatopsis sp. H20-H5]|uniref:hypothetical protein n=1 Tax=Amycolatopsis sp. H20-H5 TaxID=3046309 RepID=UPI002DBE6974|nr:hypothetical protein [Amycolatopsis sp. H20-H5]MEC3982057.1 hypothetical protein [Amycolatopsis sp. H20-H5]
MSWNDFYRRREILETAVEQARQEPGRPLSLAEIPGARELFRTEENLLLALHHQWTQLLSGHLRAELADPEDAAAEGQVGDQVDAVTRAWQRASKNHEALRAVLDTQPHPVLEPLREAERRMLAVTAGLAEPGEPVAEITKVGHALDALLRHGPVKPARRRSPMGQLLRLLAPSA